MYRQTNLQATKRTREKRDTQGVRDILTRAYKEAGRQTDRQKGGYRLRRLADIDRQTEIGDERID